MIFQPIVPVFIVLGVFAAILAFCISQVIKTKKSQPLPWMRRTAMVGLACILALGPSIPGGNAPAGMLNLDVIFAVDTSTSMSAEDYNGTAQRISGVKSDIMKLSDKMIGARFSIISFGHRVETLLPMTTDRGSLETVVSTLGYEESFRSKGTSIDAPLVAISARLGANHKQNSQRPNLVFYMGDGEQTVVKEPGTFAALREKVAGGAVLQYGTVTGGKMRQFSSDSTPGRYLEDYSDPNNFGAPALSKAQPARLKAIAEQMGVAYVDRTSGGEIDQTFGESKAERIANATRPVTFYSNLYYIFAFPLALLFIWEVIYVLRRYQELKAAAPENDRG